MRKLLHKFEHSWQAEIVQGLLQQSGIEANTMAGAREYTSIVTGIGQPPTFLYVEESDLPAAKLIVEDFERKSKLQLVEQEEAGPQPPPKNKRRLIFFAGAALVFILSFLIYWFTSN